MLVSSVPLSETQAKGQPRVAMTASSSRATRLPDSDVTATRHRHSREKSSTTARMRNRRPSGVAVKVERPAVIGRPRHVGAFAAQQNLQTPVGHERQHRRATRLR